MATYHFNGHGTAGNWSDARNWGAAGAQTAADTAIVATNSSLSMYGTATLGNVMLLGSSNVTFYGALTATAAGSCAGLMVCDNATANFAPGSSLYLPNGALEVGFNEDGTFVAQGTTANPTYIHTNNATIGRTSIAEGTLTFDHATWLNDSVLFLGLNGTGNLNVINGGQVTTAHNLAVGFTAGATGNITLSSGGNLTVGLSAAIAGGGPNSTTGTANISVAAGSTFDVKHVAYMYAGTTVTLSGGTISEGDLGGGMSVYAGAQIVGYGTITSSGTGISGTLEVRGGSMNVSGNLGGTGTIQIDSGSTIAVTSRVLSTTSISFQGTGGTLEFAAGSMVTSQISGFALGDQIETTGIDSVAYNTVTNILALSSHGHVQETLHMVGTYGAHDFSLTQVNGLDVIALHS